MRLLVSARAMACVFEKAPAPEGAKACTTLTQAACAAVTLRRSASNGSAAGRLMGCRASKGRIRALRPGHSCPPRVVRGLRSMTVVHGLFCTVPALASPPAQSRGPMPKSGYSYPLARTPGLCYRDAAATGVVCVALSVPAAEASVWGVGCRSI